MTAKATRATHTPGKRTGKGLPTQTEQTMPHTAMVTKPLTSYDIFELCVQRARNLVKLHEAAHGKAGKPEKYTSDAHRAAIVLAVSALDAFVRDLVLSRSREILASKSQALPPSLSAHIKKFLKDDDLLDAARKDDLLERLEKAFRSDFERRSFEGTKNIDEAMQIAGYQNIFHEVAVKAEMNEDTLREGLDRFTQRRHAIAHRGDYNLSENPHVIMKGLADGKIRPQDLMVMLE